MLGRSSDCRLGTLNINHIKPRTIGSITAPKEFFSFGHIHETGVVACCGHISGKIKQLLNRAVVAYLKKLVAEADSIEGISVFIIA